MMPATTDNHPKLIPKQSQHPNMIQQTFENIPTTSQMLPPIKQGLWGNGGFKNIVWVDKRCGMTAGYLLEHRWSRKRSRTKSPEKKS